MSKLTPFQQELLDAAQICGNTQNTMMNATGVDRLQNAIDKYELAKAKFRELLERAVDIQEVEGFMA